MGTLYDTGDQAFSANAGEWSSLTSITTHNYAGKIVKIVLEVTSGGTPTFVFDLFSETNSSWSKTNPVTQDPSGTTGHIYTITITSSTSGLIIDGDKYFANSDSVLAKTLYMAVFNSGGGTVTGNARILYESMDISS